MYRHALTAVLAACFSPAFAEALSDELGVFQPLLGEWSCSGQNAATPQSPPFGFLSAFRFEAVLAGQFVRVTYTEVESAALPMARNNVEYWGKAESGFTSTFFNAFGQRGELASEGPREGRLVWSGVIDTPAGALPFEGRMDVAEPGSLTVEPTLLLPDGAEFEVASLVCSRAD